MSSYFGVGGGGSPVSSPLSNKVTTPTLHVATIVAANVEQSYALPPATGWFTVVNQTVPVLKLAYVAGTSGTTYREIPRGCSVTYPQLDTSASIVLYYQSSTAGGRLEIESWA